MYRSEHIRLAKEYADERGIKDKALRDQILQAFVSGYNEAKHRLVPRELPSCIDRYTRKTVEGNKVPTSRRMRFRFEWEGLNYIELEGSSNFILKTIKTLTELNEALKQVFPEPSNELFEEEPGKLLHLVTD